MLRNNKWVREEFEDSSSDRNNSLLARTLELIFQRVPPEASDQEVYLANKCKCNNHKDIP